MPHTPKQPNTTMSSYTNANGLTLTYYEPESTGPCSCKFLDDETVREKHMHCWLCHADCCMSCAVRVDAQTRPKSGQDQGRACAMHLCPTCAESGVLDEFWGPLSCCPSHVGMDIEAGNLDELSRNKSGIFPVTVRCINAEDDATYPSCLKVFCINCQPQYFFTGSDGGIAVRHTDFDFNILCTRCHNNTSWMTKEEKGTPSTLETVPPLVNEAKHHAIKAQAMNKPAPPSPPRRKHARKPLKRTFSNVENEEEKAEAAEPVVKSYYTPRPGIVDRLNGFMAAKQDEYADAEEEHTRNKWRKLAEESTATEMDEDPESDGETVYSPQVPTMDLMGPRAPLAPMETTEACIGVFV